jgi:hypothetical protein
MMTFWLCASFALGALTSASLIGMLAAVRALGTRVPAAIEPSSEIALVPPQRSSGLPRIVSCDQTIDNPPHRFLDKTTGIAKNSKRKEDLNQLRCGRVWKKVVR